MSWWKAIEERYEGQSGPFLCFLFETIARLASGEDVYRVCKESGARTLTALLAYIEYDSTKRYITYIFDEHLPKWDRVGFDQEVLAFPPTRPIWNKKWHLLVRVQQSTIVFRLKRAAERLGIAEGTRFGYTISYNWLQAKQTVLAYHVILLEELVSRGLSWDRIVRVARNEACNPLAALCWLDFESAQANAQTPS